MDVRGVLRFFAIALLCFNLAAAGSEGNRRADELVLEYRFYSALGQINEDLVQLDIYLRAVKPFMNAT